MSVKRDKIKSGRPGNQIELNSEHEPVTEDDREKLAAIIRDGLPCLSIEPAQSGCRPTLMIFDWTTRTARHPVTEREREAIAMVLNAAGLLS